MMLTAPSSYSDALHNGDVVYGAVRGAAVEDLPASLVNHCHFEVVQLEQGSSCCDFDFVAGSQAVVCRKRISCPLHLRGVMTGGWIGLALVHDGGDGAEGGHPARDDLLHLAAPGTPFDWFLRGGQSMLFVMTNEGALMELAREAHAEEAVRSFAVSGQSLPTLRADSVAIKDARGALLDLVDGAKRGELQHTGAQLGRSVREAMIMLLDKAGESAGRCSAQILVRRAREIVGETPRRFSVSDLSGKLRVSPRTLHKAFFDITGVGPHAYFLRQRLNAARRLLATADGQQASVTNIALELGFTELGRFAGRYRSFFGENPSQTLQRPRRRIEPVPV